MKRVPDYDKLGPLRFENMLNRNFKAKNLNEKWVTDVTYNKTSLGMVYLSVIKDLYNSEIVDWKLSKRPDNELCHINLKFSITKKVNQNLFILIKVRHTQTKLENIYVILII
ncbi:hypothetical protein SCORR_v1c06250 [Spiroplasma corruscae]|uniref:Integrase catalytic domain-containing protein n=2 Tax=Spiroplasma corruscae TaxID=216934 RepID=A0A222EPG5_9MOLU|nr:hypothetical protein SCORR_v1c06250 [Spiroplasma corruscae]